eukprot:6173732-Pleurochrysis_carterae.AAC.3
MFKASEERLRHRGKQRRRGRRGETDGHARARPSSEGAGDELGGSCAGALIESDSVDPRRRAEGAEHIATVRGEDCAENNEIGRGEA